MRAVTAVTAACVAMLAVTIPAFGAVTPAKQASTFPTKCSELFTLSAADSVTGHAFTSIVTHYVHVKSYQGLDCFFHDASTPPDTSGQAGAVFLNHIIEVGIYQRTKASDAFFAKQQQAFEAEAPGRAAKYPQCQPGYQPSSGDVPLPPSMCAVLHPFGPNSLEYDDFGIDVLTSKYAILSLSGLHDTLQEPLVHLAMTKLH